jgi:hypothetical protein
LHILNQKKDEKEAIELFIKENSIMLNEELTNMPEMFKSSESNYWYLKNSVLDLYTFVKKNGFEGYDPYDGLNSEFTSRISDNNKWLKMFIIQSLKSCPINPRSILGIKKSINLKGVALITSAFLKLFKLTNEKKFLEDAQFCLDILKNNSLKEKYSNYCWVGSVFNVQFPDDLGTPNVPSIVCTVACASAFLEYYEVSGSEESLEIAKSSANFIINNLYINDKEKSFFKYTPTYNKNSIVYNASTLGVKLLSYVYKYTKNKEILDISKRVMDYIISKQKLNGAWYFSETNGIERKQIDFHQGFILEALNDFIKYTNSDKEEYIDALRKGVEFYKNEQFLLDGRCKWRYPRLWPIDIHNQAQGIITFSKLSNIRPEYLEFAKTIAKWTIDNMQDKSGYFYYQKWPVITNKIPYIRWGQAWMLLALSTLLEVS